MKTGHVFLALALLATGVFAADKAPPLPIKQALKIAQDYLRENHSGDARHIAALTLESPTLSSGRFWYARWSSAIRGEKNAEVGVQIDMEGTLTRVVTAGAAPGVGQQRYGARNIR